VASVTLKEDLLLRVLHRFGLSLMLQQLFSHCICVDSWGWQLWRLSVTCHLCWSQNDFRITCQNWSLLYWDFTRSIRSSHLPSHKQVTCS